MFQIYVFFYVCFHGNKYIFPMKILSDRLERDWDLVKKINK